MADRIGSSKFKTWFGDAAQFHLDGDQLIVTVGTAFAGRWIVSNYRAELMEVARAALGVEPHLDVRVGQPSGNGSSGTAKRTSPAAAPALSAGDSRARPRPAGPHLPGELDAFVVGSGNCLAHAAASSIVHAPGQTVRLLALYGGCGLGKTHLLQGICNGIGRSHATLEWRYVSGEEFTNEFIYAVRNNRLDKFRARFRNVDVLAIDDAHFFADKKGTQDEFLHTYNAIEASGKVLVLCTDRHPRTCNLSLPLTDRLISGMVIEIKPPDFETRREILRRRARTMQVALPDEILDFVAKYVTRNVRELEGALYKLKALAAISPEPVSLALAGDALQDFITRGLHRPDASEIAGIVARYLGVSREQIFGKSRDRTISLARAVAMTLVRKHTRLSFPEIGRAFGNKSHTTVVMATRRLKEILDRDGAVTWRTPSGRQDAPLATLLNHLEEELERPQH